MISTSNTKGGYIVSAYTKIVADVSPEVKQKLVDLKQGNESNKDVLVRLIEQEHKKQSKK
jgi:predicted CopG family antitoxin